MDAVNLSRLCRLDGNPNLRPNRAPHEERGGRHALCGRMKGGRTTGDEEEQDPKGEWGRVLSFYFPREGSKREEGGYCVRRRRRRRMEEVEKEDARSAAAKRGVDWRRRKLSIKKFLLPPPPVMEGEK